ncbi:tyrosine-protein phosphatase [Leucobacter sp. BZR 635]
MNTIALQGSYNARGVGAEAEPWLVRSAAPDAITPNDEAILRAAGVDLILDLRETAEHGERLHLLPVVSVPLYGETPPAAGSLEDIYLGLIQRRGAALAEAVATIADHPGVCLVHCAAGKDRTGLVVALARLAAGESRPEVVDDYTRSGETVRPARRGLVAAQLDALQVSGAERAAAERLHLDSPGEALETAIAALDAWGGAAEYLLAHGVESSQLAALRARAGAQVVSS